MADARGEFVMFLDDDDLLRRDALAKLVEALRVHPDAAAAAGACRILQVNGDSVKVYHPAKLHQRGIWRELLFGWWANSGQNLFRAEIVRKVGGFDAGTVPCEDRKLWLAIARLGPVCLVPRVTMEYRQHDGQSKPANVHEIRQRVWSDFIRGLPESARAEARRVRRAAEQARQAASRRVAREFGAATRLQVQACLMAPRLLSSPLTGRPLWWGLKKCLLRVDAP